ncbi:Retrovirus-related Pol Polyprotein from transposon TNT 1-94 [Phytophthora megakarya]|uniref:Retrovirus-related Pol Polyprotein from transposon TNT 1-94 n=1 Tax=Phytophthora megakarya TaxID=4795 RepID=A0A225W402_9STRA|nr:Retrovirus-related Pol Polyprotein from transposon TNT 1-94 [Phytophthora megakarya]
MRYLSGYKHLGLVYRYDRTRDDLKIGAFADADHTGCPETSRAVSGWILPVNVALIE